MADLDNDGKLEVILGTSLGFLYVIDHKGDVKPGWPVTMAEIQGQVAVGDVNDDGQLELVATDNRFNVVVFNWRGKEVWERRISGFSAQVKVYHDELIHYYQVFLVYCVFPGISHDVRMLY